MKRGIFRRGTRKEEKKMLYLFQVNFEELNKVYITKKGKKMFFVRISDGTIEVANRWGDTVGRSPLGGSRLYWRGRNGSYRELTVEEEKAVRGRL
ncbi:MAG: hypothetical protein DRN66_03745 [Candidatus Nanohalarchaeota archaeon]|nr:MAG: hypothetical protein DRN66_03745 [Candidatus Nanohaloarchaeota archaeon]